MFYTCFKDKPDQRKYQKKEVVLLVQPPANKILFFSFISS